MCHLEGQQGQRLQVVVVMGMEEGKQQQELDAVSAPA